MAKLAVLFVVLLFLIVGYKILSPKEKTAVKGFLRWILPVVVIAALVVVFLFFFSFSVPNVKVI